MKKGLILLMSTVVAWGSSNKVNPNRWFLEMEAGPVWQSSNEVKIPGTTGTKFSLKDFGGGPSFLEGFMEAIAGQTEVSFEHFLLHSL